MADNDHYCLYYHFIRCNTQPGLRCHSCHGMDNLADVDDDGDDYD